MEAGRCEEETIFNKVFMCGPSNGKMTPVLNHSHVQNTSLIPSNLKSVGQNVLCYIQFFSPCLRFNYMFLISMSY